MRRVTVVILELQIIVEQISFQIFLKSIQRSCRFGNIRKSIPKLDPNSGRVCYAEHPVAANVKDGGL